MSPQIEVRHLKGTSEKAGSEMARDYSHLKFRRARKVVPNLVELDLDIAVFFRNATAVNKALRMFMEAVPGPKNGKGRKSA